jgi:hypothetical protein
MEPIENSAANNDNTMQFQTHKLPYTSNPKTLEKWALHAIKKCYAKSRSTSTMFGWSREDVANSTPNNYLMFVEEMISFYEGTWSGKGLEFLTKEETDDQVLPARLQNYPLLKNNFDIITGQFIQTGIDLSVASVSPEAITKKMNKRVTLMFNKLLGSDVKGYEETTGVDLEHDMPVVDDEDQYITLKWKEIEELNMSKLLKLCYTKHEWPEQIRKAMLYQLILGYFAYQIVEVNGDEVKIRIEKPQSLLMDWNCEDDFGDDLMFIGAERYLSLNGIQQGIKPSPEKLKEIKELYVGTIENGGADNATAGSLTSRNGIRVIDMTWYVDRRVKAKIVENKYDPSKKIVKILKQGEEGKLSKKEKGEIKEIEVGGWYHGYLIGDTIVCNSELMVDMPVEDGKFDMPKNDWVVGLYNRLNKKPNGMLASIKGIQELWNELMFKLELEIATSPGQVIEYAADGKPADLSYSQVFYYMKAKKLVVTKKPGSSRALDMGLSSAQHILNLLMYIENLADSLTGTTKFKKGNVAGDTYVGTMNSAIEQADLLLVPYFSFHKAALRKLFKRAAAKLTLLNQTETEKIKYLLGESGFEYFTVQRTLPTDMWDIYFIDGTEQKRKKDMLMMLFDKAFSTGQATIEHAMAIIKHDNIQEIYSALGSLLEENKKQAAAREKLAAQIEQAKLQQPMQLEQLKGQITNDLEKMKKEFDTTIAKLYADAGIKKEVVVKELEDRKDTNPN